MNKAAAAVNTMTAAQILNAFCPAGDAAEGCVVEQNWEEESTVITFDDGSKVNVSGSRATAC